MSVIFELRARLANDLKRSIDLKDDAGIAEKKHNLRILDSCKSYDGYFLEMNFGPKALMKISQEVPAILKSVLPRSKSEPKAKNEDEESKVIKPKESSEDWQMNLVSRELERTAKLKTESQFSGLEEKKASRALSVQQKELQRKIEENRKLLQEATILRQKA